MNSKTKNKSLWVLRILAALIMLQTLFFKFSASEESVYIFSRIGMEPWGRITTGIFELLASLLILSPRFTALGALLGIGLMGGALFFHLTSLGIVVKGDGGQLFIYAIVVLISCIIVFTNYKQQLFNLLKWHYK